MLKKSNKDYSGKLAAVSAMLDQLSVETLKSSNLATLHKFRERAQQWAELAAAELARRGE